MLQRANFANNSMLEVIYKKNKKIVLIIIHYYNTIL